MRIDCEERVENWLVSGEKRRRSVQAVDGCYVVEVKYREDYVRMHTASRLWRVSLLGGAADVASHLHTRHYETDYVPFALQVRSQRSYYVTATFDGDVFLPRIVETNAASERTREILPVRSTQELDDCRAHGPVIEDKEDAICVGESEEHGHESPGM